MRKNITLNKNVHFQRVYRNGKSYVSPLVVTYVLRRQSGGVRFGITTSKKIGSAVERNRARRIIKAAAGSVLLMSKGSYDFVFVARKAALKAKSTDVYRLLCDQLQKAGILSNNFSIISCVRNEFGNFND